MVIISGVPIFRIFTVKMKFNKIVFASTYDHKCYRVNSAKISLSSRLQSVISLANKEI